VIALCALSVGETDILAVSVAAAGAFAGEQCRRQACVDRRVASLVAACVVAVATWGALALRAWFSAWHGGGSHQPWRAGALVGAQFLLELGRVTLHVGGAGGNAQAACAGAARVAQTLCLVL
jgi:hypothetical protein